MILSVLSTCNDLICHMCWTRILSFSDGHLVCLCEGPKCPQATQCHGTQCFSSVKVGSNGVLFERGCLLGPDKIRLLCSIAPSFHQAIHCCSQDRCNSNTTRNWLMSLLPSGLTATQNLLHVNMETAKYSNCARNIVSYKLFSYSAPLTYYLFPQPQKVNQFGIV